jgi:hypothetical protein
LEDVDPELKNDPQFQQFMTVMKPKSAVKTWANEDTFLEGIYAGICY